MSIRFRALLIVTVMASLLGVFQSDVRAAVQAQDATPPIESEQVPVRFGILPADASYGSYFSDVVVEPGETITLEAAILNLGEQPVQLRAYAANVSSGPNGGFVTSMREDPLTAPATWLTIPVFEESVAAKSQKNVSLTVSVPEGTDPGQYISAVVVETVDTFEIPGNNMFDQRVRYALAVGILVPGQITPMFELGQPFIDRGILEIPIENTGNYLVKPAGTLTVTNSEGDEIASTSVAMGSVYSGTSTTLSGTLPEHLPPGVYTVSVNLVDEASGFEASLTDVEFTVEDQWVSTGILIVASAVEPNAKDLVYANVSVTLDNNGGYVPAADVVLEVSRNGSVVEEYLMATNQVILSGENTLSDRYIPEQSWEPGTYTFRLMVLVNDPSSGQQTEILNEALDVELIVP